MSKKTIIHAEGPKIYIAGPMTNIPFFNKKAFDNAAILWRSKGWDVFNPAEKDEEVHGKDWLLQFPNGSVEEAIAAGFSLSRALKDDLSWICEHAHAVYFLRGWEKSNGANAEWATAKALGLEIYYE